MQITRLQLILLLIALGCTGFAVYTWVIPHSVSRASPEPHERPAPVSRPVAPVSPVLPVVSSALPAVKPHPSVPAVSSGPETSTPDRSSDVYEVVRGDTLWRIARDHSPVHQGPGWVKIWKVNKSMIKDFDRLEVGWNLQIPPDPTVYATAYWKPRLLAKGYGRAHDLGVDVAQLPVPAEFSPGQSNWPPEIPRALVIALLQSEPVPHELEVALLQSSPIPHDLRIALATSEPIVSLTQAPRRDAVLDASRGEEQIASIRLIPQRFMSSAQLP